MRDAHDLEKHIRVLMLAAQSAFAAWAERGAKRMHKRQGASRVRDPCIPLMAEAAHRHLADDDLTGSRAVLCIADHQRQCPLGVEDRLRRKGVDFEVIPFAFGGAGGMQSFRVFAVGLGTADVLVGGVVRGYGVFAMRRRLAAAEPREAVPFVMWDSRPLCGRRGRSSDDDR